MSRTIAITLLLAFVPVLHAGEPSADDIRARIAELNPHFRIDDVRTTGVEGLFEVTSGANVFYMTGDGRFLLRGQLIDLETGRNLTAERRTGLVHEVVESVGEDSMLVFSPSNGPAEHQITVFTDTTCPYCQQLHLGLLEMIEEYPVKVRYLAFPRAGLEAASAETLRNVWCAPDPQQAMTAAKAGQSVPERDPGCSTPVDEHFQLGQRIGVSGTPYLLVDDGQIVPGYRDNATLLQMMGLGPGSDP